MSGRLKAIAESRWVYAGVIAAAIALSFSLLVPPVIAAEDQDIHHLKWSFSGPFGMFDQDQLRRGYQVYRTVCSHCHSMNLLSYRNLGDPGGPDYSQAEVKAMAAEAQVTDGPNDKGAMFTRPGRPSDRFVAPFPNPEAARAALGGALPPDLSVMAKAREGGPDYIYSVLTGFANPPAGFKMAPGMHYNKAFPGHQIAMPPPLSDGVVSYANKKIPETVDQYATDVSAFLMWAAEPTLEERHIVGARIMIFLFVFAVIMYLAKRAVWQGEHHEAI
jgi:cytochrome c1